MSSHSRPPADSAKMGTSILGHRPNSLPADDRRGRTDARQRWNADLRPLLIERSGLPRSGRKFAMAPRPATRAPSGRERRRPGILAGRRRRNGDRSNRESRRFIRGRLRCDQRLDLLAVRAGPKLANWSSPAVLRGKGAGDDLVLLQSTTGVSAHDPLTGKERWSYPIECDGIASAAVDGPMICLPAKGIQGAAT